MKKIIYFDSAATSWPKPKSVKEAVAKAFEKNGGNPGRSSHILSYNAAKAVYSCREKVCDLLGSSKPENVIFTCNATLALNTAIKGLVKKNWHIIISNLEHNSVIRPVFSLSTRKDLNISYSIFNASCDNDVAVKNFADCINPDTHLAVITMASNVCGKILPVKRISDICKARNILLIVDASQGAGCIPFGFDELGADVLCTAGHKGLYGPMGTGLCIFADTTDPDSIIQGGNGVSSANPDMNDCPLPERLEAGTLAVPSICGLCAGLDYVKNIGTDEIYAYGHLLCDYLTTGLKNISGVTVYGDYAEKTPCVLFNINKLSSEKTSELLAAENICVRSGLHCAPLAHAALGTGESGGVRASMSHGNSIREIDTFVKSVAELARQ